MAPVSGSQPRPAAPRTPPPSPAPQAKAPKKEEKNPVEIASNSTKLVGDSFLATQQKKTPGTRKVGGVPLPGSLRQGNTVEGKNTPLARAGNALGAGAGAANLVTAGQKFNSAREALKNGDTRKAVEDGSSAASSVLNAGKSALETGSQVREFREVRNAARDAITDRARTDGVAVSKKDATRIAKQNANDALAGLGRNERREAARQAATRVGQREALRAPAQAGAAAAAAKTGATTAGKAAGRFVPGLNVAIAAADTANAVATLKDPEASGVKKGAAVVTAVGSWAAATNIPIVSQAGGVISTASSVIGSIFG